MTCIKSINDLKIKESGCYDIESKISYELVCASPKIPTYVLFPEGITIIYNDLSLSSITGSISFNNNTYNSINQGSLILIITGNINFGMLTLSDNNTGDVIKGSFSNTSITGNYLQPTNITLTGGTINGCVISAATSQATLSTGSIISLQFVSDATIIDPNTMITLSYNGQVVLPYKPQIGLFNNDKLLFKTKLPSSKMNKFQLLYNVLLQLGDVAGTVFYLTRLNLKIPIFNSLSISLYTFLLIFPPPIIPNIPDAYIVLDNAEVVLGTKAELKCSDILSVKLLCSDDSFSLKLLCKGSNFVLNKI
ncbi:MAG: hypothetical protein QW478_01100 [Candidatus Micrarchaeaceae archaeon]